MSETYWQVQKELGDGRTRRYRWLCFRGDGAKTRITWANVGARMSEARAKDLAAKHGGVAVKISDGI